MLIKDKKTSKYLVFMFSFFYASKKDLRNIVATKGNCFSPDVAFAQAGYNVPTELMSPIREMIKN